MLCDSIREHTTIIQKPDSQMAEPYSQMAEVLTQLTSQMTNGKYKWQVKWQNIQHNWQVDDTNDNQMTEHTRYNINGKSKNLP